MKKDVVRLSSDIPEELLSYIVKVIEFLYNKKKDQGA